jgi:hypothetical protein
LVRSSGGAPPHGHRRRSIGSRRSATLAAVSSRFVPLTSLAAVVVGLGLSADVHAYCRSTTCSTTKTRPAWCVRDEATGCERNGAPLLWQQGCVSFSVQADGLGSYGYAELEEAVRLAFERWTQADCGGGRRPSISVVSRGPVRCGRTEFNNDGPNANVISGVLGDWPYADNAVAVTSSTFDTSTGLMRDSDILVRDEGFSPADLAGTLTHEVGHFLGLDHSIETGSIMEPARHFGVSTEAPTLSADDVAGICAVYPPERVTPACQPEPENGLGTECGGVAEGGCQLGTTPLEGWWVAAALGAAGVGRHLRRRSVQRR